MLTIIVACAENRAIGKGNTIPWFAPEDLAMFKGETVGGAIIMGRNTWDSLPRKPLPSRENIVVSSTMQGDFICPDFQSALQLAKDKRYSRTYAIGGASIYKEALKIADRLLITNVDITVPDADTFFPEFAAEDWVHISSMDLRAEAPACVLNEYIRRR